MCGAAPGDIDDLTGCRASFYVKLIASADTAKNQEILEFETLCSSCEGGIREVRTVKPPAIWLLSQIRQAGQEEQRAVLDWLLKMPQN
jgi:hypothetical protein